MTELVEFIKDTLDIPVIEENGRVVDGCFFATPYNTTTFNGNGNVLIMDDSVSIDLFYNDKIDCVSATHSLIKAFNTVNKYKAQSPTYTYEDEANMYHSIINVVIIGGLN